jgi:uroporphyrinogen-III synthase
MICLLRESEGESDLYMSTLASFGFETLFVPVLAFDLHLDAASSALSARELSGLVITSQRAAAAVSQVLTDELREHWSGRPLFTVGEKTARLIAKVLGRTPDLCAPSAEALSAEILSQLSPAVPLLFLCGDKRLDHLPTELRSHGFMVNEVVVYSSKPQAPTAPADPTLEISWVVFFSPSGVRAATADPAPLWWRQSKIAAIGNTTAKELETAGIVVDAIAHAPSPDGLAQALVAAAKSNAA